MSDMAEIPIVSDWATEFPESHGVVQAIDETQGIGVIAPVYQSFLTGLVVFFLEEVDGDLDEWSTGLSVGDCVSFQTKEMIEDDRQIMERSRELKPFLANNPANENRDPYDLLTDQYIAVQLKKLDDGSVILEEPLSGHPRYKGIVESALSGDDIIDKKSCTYREGAIAANHSRGWIRVVQPYFQRKKASLADAIPNNAHSQLQSMSHTHTNSAHASPQIRSLSARGSFSAKDDPIDDVVSEKSNESRPYALANGNKVEYLEKGEMVSFQGIDLLSTRIILEPGDIVEFDAYKNRKTNKICATRVIFLDPSPVGREFGMVSDIRGGPYGHNYQGRGGPDSGPVHGTIMRLNKHEAIQFNSHEILDRDVIPSHSDEVEFTVRFDESKKFEYASRITMLPRKFIQLNTISEERYTGKVVEQLSADTSRGKGMGSVKFKPAIIEYRPNEDSNIEFVEVYYVKNEQNTLIQGDKVSFRIEMIQEFNVLNKRAVHVVVIDEAVRQKRGSIFNLLEQYGFIQYENTTEDRIFFSFREWINDDLRKQIGMHVEFSEGIDSKGRKEAVRVRPTELPSDNPQPDRKGGHMIDSSSGGNRTPTGHHRHGHSDGGYPSQHQHHRHHPHQHSHYQPGMGRGAGGKQRVRTHSGGGGGGGHHPNSSQHSSQQPPYHVPPRHQHGGYSQNINPNPPRGRGRGVPDRSGGGDMERSDDRTISRDRMGSSGAPPPPNTQGAPPTTRISLKTRPGASMYRPTPIGAGPPGLTKPPQNQPPRNQGDLNLPATHQASGSRGAKPTANRPTQARRVPKARTPRTPNDEYDSEEDLEEEDMEDEYDEEYEEYQETSRGYTSRNRRPPPPQSQPRGAKMGPPQISKPNKRFLEYYGTIVTELESPKSVGVIEYSYDNNNNKTTIEFELHQFAKWQSNIHLRRRDGVILYFAQHSPDAKQRQLRFFTLVDPIYSKRYLGEVKRDRNTKNFVLTSLDLQQPLPFQPNQIIDQEAQKSLRENNSFMFDIALAKIKRAVRLYPVFIDDKKQTGSVNKLPTKQVPSKQRYGIESTDGEIKMLRGLIRFGITGIRPDQREKLKVGDTVQFNFQSLSGAMRLKHKLNNFRYAINIELSSSGGGNLSQSRNALSSNTLAPNRSRQQPSATSAASSLARQHSSSSNDSRHSTPPKQHWRKKPNKNSSNKGENVRSGGRGSGSGPGSVSSSSSSTGGRKYVQKRTQSGAK